MDNGNCFSTSPGKTRSILCSLMQPWDLTTMHIRLVSSTKRNVDVIPPAPHYAEWSWLRDAPIARGFREQADDWVSQQILAWSRILFWGAVPCGEASGRTGKLAVG